jgi:hypothetical protein
MKNMIKGMHKKFLPLIVFLGTLILLLVGLFFFITSRTLGLQKINEQIIHLIREDDFQEAIILINEISLLEQNNYLLKNFSFIPLVKEEFELSRHLVSIKKGLEEINNGTLLSAMIQQQEDPLFVLNSLKDDLNYLEKYNLDWVETKKYQVENWLSFFGKEKEKNYLVLFQNPDIPRPSGGFIGAYTILSFNQGKINFSGNNIFVLEEVFLKKIIPPIPFQEIGDRWFFRDVNWFFDFPLTGQKILSFYEQTEKKPDLDGVIFINPSVIELMLETIGPIEIRDYNLVINEVNFLSFYKKQIQEAAKPAPLREEKELLSLFFQEFQRELKKSSIEKLALIPRILKERFEEKEAQIYITDDNLEYFFNSFGWTGKIKESRNDYLSVNFSFINEGFIEDLREKEVELKTEFASGGETINYLTVSAPNFSSGQRLLENYIKIYLPKGVIIKEAIGSYLKKNYNADQLEDIYNKLDYHKDEDLLLIERNTIKDEKNGIEIYEEGGKTVVGFWSQLSIRPFILIYELPDDWRKFSSWETIIQKQSGQRINFSFELLIPEEVFMVPSLFPFNQFIPLDKDLILNFKREY